MNVRHQRSWVPGVGFMNCFFQTIQNMQSDCLRPGSRLWAVVGGKRFEVKHDGAQLFPKEVLRCRLTASPWSRLYRFPKFRHPGKHLYPPPLRPTDYRIRAGQDSRAVVLRASTFGSICKRVRCNP